MIGIDLAKTVFQIHGVDERGKVAVRKQLKRAEQQAILSVHRARQGFVKARTAQGNQIRGLLAEFGIVIPQGIGTIAKRIPEILEDAENGLPGAMRNLLARLADNLKEMDRQAKQLEAQIQQWHRDNAASRKLAEIPGLGPITRRVLQGSQHVIVPLQCEPLALQTTPQILRGIQDVVATNDDLTLDGILLTMYDASNTGCARVAEYVRTHLPHSMVFDVMIPRTLATSEAFAAGQPVVLRDPSDPASQAYINLATQLSERFE